MAASKYFTLTLYSGGRDPLRESIGSQQECCWHADRAHGVTIHDWVTHSARDHVPPAVTYVPSDLVFACLIVIWIGAGLLHPLRAPMNFNQQTFPRILRSAWVTHVYPCSIRIEHDDDEGTKDQILAPEYETRVRLPSFALSHLPIAPRDLLSRLALG